MVRITIDLPESALAAVRASPEEFGQRLRVAAAAKWYEIGLVSQGKAAEIAGLTRVGFLEALATFGVSPFQTTRAELEQELGR